MGEFRCTSCNALLHESSYRKNNGMCALCASSTEKAERRRAIAEAQKAKGIVNPQCGGCGIFEDERHRQTAEAERMGAFIYLKDWPTLLYCEACDKYFCGRCQVDLGAHAGCPECRSNLEA